MFNQEIFLQNLSKNSFIKTIKLSDTKFKITFMDQFKLYVILGDEDSIHKYYTNVGIENYNKYYYRNMMPHQSLADLYHEIWRMSDPKSRHLLPKCPGFKSF